MRSVTLAEAARAAAMLAELPAAERPVAAAALLLRADTADRYRRETGHWHPTAGDGCLASALPAASSAPPAFLSNPDFLDAMGTILAALKAFRS